MFDLAVYPRRVSAVMIMMMMMMMMMNCFCGMVDRWKAFSFISSRDHCQRSSPSWISDMPWAGFEPAQNLSSGLVEWSCVVVITTTPRCHWCDSLFRFDFIGKKGHNVFPNFFVISYKFYIKVFKVRPFQFPKKANTNVALIIVSCFSCFSSFF